MSDSELNNCHITLRALTKEAVENYFNLDAEGSAGIAT
jgi:hypothetical protein